MAKEVEALIRTGLALERRGLTQTEAAHEVGLAYTSYTCGKMVIVLTDMDLPPTPAAQVQKARDHLNTTGLYQPSFDMVRDVMLRVWGEANGRKRRDDPALRIEAIIAGSAVVRESAEAMLHLDFPYFSEEASAEIQKNLNATIRAVHKVLKLVKESSS